MNSVESILEIISEWSDGIGSYTLALVAVGALSMALLQAIKGIFKLKASYHEHSLKFWLREELKQYLDKDKLPPGESRDGNNPNESENDKNPDLESLANEGTRQVISLATGVPADRINSDARPYSVFHISPERSLYTLPLDKMMGQIQESTEIILEDPNLYRSAFYLLSGTANQKDVEKWLSYRSPEKESEDDPQKMARVGNRIQQSVQRQLDTFQLKTEYKWSRWNQMISFLIGAVVLFSAILYSRSDSKMIFEDLPEIILLSLLGGFTAPVAKDLVTNLRKVKVRE